MELDIVQNMLDAHFPDSIHEDILQATGIDLTFKSTGRQKRRPKFPGEYPEGIRISLRGMRL